MQACTQCTHSEVWSQLATTPECLFEIGDWQREKKRWNGDRRAICDATSCHYARRRVICHQGVSDSSAGERPLWRSHSAWTEMFFLWWSNIQSDYESTNNSDSDWIILQNVPQSTVKFASRWVCCLVWWKVLTLEQYSASSHSLCARSHTLMSLSRWYSCMFDSFNDCYSYDMLYQAMLFIINPWQPICVQKFSLVT